MIRHGVLNTAHFARCYRPKRTRLTDPVEDMILTTLASRKKEPMVLEIGTYLGHTTANLARVVKPLGGRVMTVDVKSRPPSLPEVQHGEVLPESMIGSKIPQELRDTVDLVLVDGEVGVTYDDIRRCVGCVDLVFIDGDHSYQGVQRDVLESLGCLSRDGVVLFHDVWWDVDPPPVDGPLRFLSELKFDSCVVNFTHIGMFKDHLEKVGGIVC